MELQVLHGADLVAPHAYVYRPGGPRALQLAAAARPGQERLTLPCLAFVLRHPEEGVILVDTGLHPDAHADLRKDLGTLMSVVFRGLRPAGPPFDAQLREAGVDPGEVRRVVMTHLHADHTGGMRLLPRAEFVVAAREWRAARGRGAARQGYVAGHLPPEDRVRLVDPERDGAPHGPFDRTLDLLGDGTVRLVSTPGHTRGHLSVLLALGDGREVLLAGDAAYTRRGIDEQRLPLLTADDGAARRSLAQLSAFTRERPEAVVVPTHDATAWHELR